MPAGTDLDLAVQIRLRAHEFSRGLRQSERGVSRFASGIKREMGGLGKILRGVHGQLAALGLAVGARALIKDAADMNQSILQIGQTAGATTKQIGGLHSRLVAMAMKTGAPVENLKQGFESLVAAGMDWKTSLSVLRAMNPVVAETGVQTEALAHAAQTAHAVFGVNITDFKTITKLYDQMYVAGQAGNAELQDLAPIFARVGAFAKAAGFDVKSTLAVIEGLSTALPKDELATYVSAGMRVFTTSRVMRDVNKATGVHFFDKKHERRDPLAVLADLRKQYQALTSAAARNNWFNAAFGHTDIRTQTFIRDLLSGDMLDQIRKIQHQADRSSGAVARQLPASLRLLNVQASRLRTTLKNAAYSFTSPIDKTIAKIIKFGLDSKKQGGLGLSGGEMIGLGAGAVGLGYLGYRVGPKLVRGLLGKAGGLGTGVATGKALQAAAGVLPVYVVNMPAAGIAGALGRDLKGGYKGIARDLKGGGARGVLDMARRFHHFGPTVGGLATGGVGGLARLAGGVGIAATGGYMVGTEISKHFVQGTSFGDWLGSVLAHGMAFFGDDKAQQAIRDMNHAQKVQIQMHVKLDQDGRARVQKITTSAPDATVDVDSGRMMFAP